MSEKIMDADLLRSRLSRPRKGFRKRRLFVFLRAGVRALPIPDGEEIRDEEEQVIRWEESLRLHRSSESSIRRKILRQSNNLQGAQISPE